MSAEFYLFDVDHGQCAALRLPDGRWCLFDAGGTASFSPVSWIVSKVVNAHVTPYERIVASGLFRFHKTTISHFHGDHLADWPNLVKKGFDFIKTIQPDQEYMTDCEATNTEQSWPLVSGFASHVAGNYSGVAYPDYGGLSIRELSLPVNIARQLGGDANARVNNASVVTRIDVYGNSILLCGDMMKEAWDAIITDRGEYGTVWRPFLSDIDILVAPHHGHRTGFSTQLLDLAKPAVVLVSVVSNDPNVDNRYSQAPVRGLRIGEDTYGYMSTRQQGHIKIDIAPPLIANQKGARTWAFGPAAL